MEKNILPVGVANTRQNLDTYSYGALDTTFTNCFFEAYKDSQTETQKVFLIKRPGISNTVTTGSGLTNSVGLGCFTAQPYDTNNTFLAEYNPGFGRAYVYQYNGVSTQYIVDFPLPAQKRVNFVNIGLPDDAYTTAWTAGSTLYLAKDRTTVTSRTPSGSITSDLTRPVYLNNRVFVGDRTTGVILQSNLGDYATYSTSDVISAEAHGGKLVDLARYGNFIVAIKEYSTELFEDVGNLNGSVLGRVGQALQKIGSVHPNTIVDTGGGELIWLALDEAGNHSVVRMKDSFKPQEIDDPRVAKYLNLINNYDGCYAFMLNSNGHQFYVLTLKQSYTDKTNATDVTNVTFVYDLDNGLWTHWNTTGSAGSFVFGGTTYNNLGRWNVSGACRTVNNNTYIQNYNTGYLHQLDDSFTTDFNTNFTVKIQIANLDLGTEKRKFLNKLLILCDEYLRRDLTDPFDTGSQYFNVALYRQDLTQPTSSWNVFAIPYAIYALGSYKGRFTISITHTYPKQLRVSAINLDYDIGEGYAISG